MEKVEIKTDLCENCGVGVRENTLFCYNCGHSVVEDAIVRTEPDAASSDLDNSRDAATKSALGDLGERLRIQEISDGKLAKAAAERRKSRVIHRRRREFAWEAFDEPSSRFVLLLAVLITVIALVVVFLTVYRK